MTDEKLTMCIDCKRFLPANEEYFSSQKKGKYGLNNVCLECQSHRKFCGIGSKWRKNRLHRHINPVPTNIGSDHAPNSPTDDTKTE